MCRVQVRHCSRGTFDSKILSSLLAVRKQACGTYEDRKEGEKETEKLCAIYTVYVCWGVMHCTRGPACRQMVPIYLATPAYSSEGSLAEGKRRDWSGGEGGQGGGGSMAGGPHLAQLNPTSAARPVLADLKAISAETEGAVSRHDAAVAAPELVAGWQELCRVEERKRKVRIGERGNERVCGMGNYFLIWEITFFYFPLSVTTAPLSFSKNIPADRHKNCSGTRVSTNYTWKWKCLFFCRIFFIWNCSLQDQ